MRMDTERKAEMVDFKVEFKVEQTRMDTERKAEMVDLKVEQTRMDTERKVEQMRMDTERKAEMVDLKVEFKVEQTRMDTERKVEQTRMDTERKAETSQMVTALQDTLASHLVELKTATSSTCSKVTKSSASRWPLAVCARSPVRSTTRRQTPGRFSPRLGL